jgi:hypothetical protein
MNKDNFTALLGRPLSTVEDANFDLYYGIALEMLESLLCTPIHYAESETRTFDVREGYSTAFINIFMGDVASVSIDGVVVDPSTYSKMKWSDRSAKWYNSLVFDTPFTSYDKELSVTADWGFFTDETTSDIPYVLQVLLAALFDSISKKNKYDSSISQKRVEDFSVSFNTGADIDEGIKTKYASIISEYGMCNIPNVQHGGC